MPRRNSLIFGVCVSAILLEGCNIGVDLTGLNFGFGGGPIGDCAGCYQMDPGTNQRILVGDTIDIFFQADSATITWQYDPAAFVALQPSNVVKHQGYPMSHIALRSLTAGSSSVSATGRAKGQIDVQAIPVSDIGGIGIERFRCPAHGIVDCPREWLWRDTSALRVSDTLRVVSTGWDKTGNTFNTNAQWTSSNPAVASVSRILSEYYTASVPVVIATGPGKATIGATVKGVSSSMEVTVLR